VTKILLVGDEIVDQYVYAEAVKMSEEAPVLVVREKQRTQRAGGAANVRDGLRRLGAEVDCLFGYKKPSVKTRIVVDGQQVLRLDNDNFEKGGPPDDLADLLDWCDLVAVSDYAKGVVSDRLIWQISDFGRPLVVDPYKQRYMYGKNVAMIKPNRAEAESVTGVKITSVETLDHAGKRYLEMSQAETVVITLGAEGMALFDRKTYWDKPWLEQTVRAELVDITGAGDTAFAVLAFIWAQPSFSKRTAVGYAVKAASIAVQHPGTYVVSREEVFDESSRFHERLL
jgi:D-beta-D-heptose 7-phosphate kinase/D-beta-D-heptose 1-phosphate adenosyltransferase